MAVALGDLARQHGPDGPVDVPDIGLDLDRRPFIESRPRPGDEFVVEGLVEPVILVFAIVDRDVGTHFRLVEQPAQVDALGLPVIDGLPAVQQVHPADHFVDRPEAEPGHDPANFLGDQEQIVDHVLRLALEPFSQYGVLRRDADRAGVEMALAHHDAAGRHQGRGRDAVFVGAEQRPDGHVASGPHAAVHLDANPAAELVQHQRLVGLGKADLPRRARMEN